MSDTPPTMDDFPTRVAGRWQIPLLAFSLVMLAIGLWRLKPDPVPPTFEQLYAQADHLRESHLFPEASEYIEKLITTPELLGLAALTEPQRRQLHGLMADVIFEHELTNAVHGQSNARRIIDHTALSLGPEEVFSAKTHRRRAMAFEWLRSEVQAIAEYKAAIDRGVDDPWALRKRVIELHRAVGGLSAEELHEQYDSFIYAAGVPSELRYWAADAKVSLFGQERRHNDAEMFLAAFTDLFDDPAFRDELAYLRAKVWWQLGEYEESEKVLRSLHGRIDPGRSLYARAGWLLGRVLQAQEAPAFALAAYEEVIEHTTPGPYRVGATMGRAECLAGLQRYDESVEAFEETIRGVSDDPYDSVVDLREVRDSTLRFYEQRLREEQFAEAMPFLRISARLVKPVDTEAQANYAQRLGDLAFSLGDRAQATGQPANAHFIEAAEHYLRLAKLVSLDGLRSTEATWRAADAYDRAGERAEVASVLDTFLRERPQSPRAPEALLRLGQTYQAMREYDLAIERYQRNLTLYPSAIFAIRSLVPLADCFIVTGDLDKAEQTLLRMVDPVPDDQLGLVEPTAQEYREALFTLGDLYVMREENELAIARYEVALERYPDDPRADRVTYRLAEAYRKSAEHIRTDINNPENIAYRDDLQAKYHERLERAEQLYRDVINRYANRPVDQLNDLDRLCFKLSHFKRADSVFDRSRVGTNVNPAVFAEALEIYDRAAWHYQDDPMAMAAYVQMVTCHLRLGQLVEARMTLQRARWALKGISDEQFERFSPPDQGRAFWEDYLAWLEKTPTFTTFTDAVTRADDANPNTTSAGG